MRSFPEVITSVAEMKQWRRSKTGLVGFVPTMGALHAGHETLLKKIRSRCDFSILSIFVNPAQFRPHEDLSKYPRNFEKDFETAKQAEVDLIFAPTSTELYPPNFSTFAEETSISQPLCGQYRPGHFRGVATIVLKLFQLIQPQIALFGLKDAQQFFIIDRMVRDLHLDVRIEGVPTLREKDGLARSSRNIYLSPEEREKAPQLYQALLTIQKKIEEQPCLHPIDPLLEESLQLLKKYGFKIEYLECLSLPEFKSFVSPLQNPAPGIIAAAVYLGQTRLIDNIILYPQKLLDRGFHFIS